MRAIKMLLVEQLCACMWMYSYIYTYIHTYIYICTRYVCVRGMYMYITGHNQNVVEGTGTCE